MEVVVEFALIHELRVLSADRLKFYSDLEVRFDVQALEDLAERAFVDFADYFVVLSHLLGHLRHLSMIYLNDN